MANNFVNSLQPRHLVLVISVLRCPHTKKVGGAERVLTNLANHWAEMGYKVSIITLFSAEIPTFYPLHPSVTIIPCKQNLHFNFILVRLLIYSDDKHSPCFSLHIAFNFSKFSICSPSTGYIKLDVFILLIKMGVLM